MAGLAGQQVDTGPTGQGESGQANTAIARPAAIWPAAAAYIGADERAVPTATSSSGSSSGTGGFASPQVSLRSVGRSLDGYEERSWASA
jgi:hypothetical protein